MVGKNEALKPLVFATETINVAGHEGHEYSIDMTAAAGGPPIPEIKASMEKLFGPGGKFRLQFVADRRPNGAVGGGDGSASCGGDWRDDKQRRRRRRIQASSASRRELFGRQEPVAIIRQSARLHRMDAPADWTRFWAR